jgi:hypothetical protein
MTEYTRRIEKKKYQDENKSQWKIVIAFYNKTLIYRFVLDASYDQYRYSYLDQMCGKSSKIL